MKIVIIGGTGLVGQKLVTKLKALGHEPVAASPSRGVNSVTGEGLAEALAGAQVVVDVTNSPSWDDQAVLEFFQTSTRNLLAAEKAAGVGHHVAVSIIGADGIPDSGYMRAKVAQEKVIQAGGVPYTILRATQFFEFLEGIAWANTSGDTVRQPTALMQPVAAEDVAETLADIAPSLPANGIVELAGPEAFPLDELVRRYLLAKQDKRQVITDDQAGYFGAKLKTRDLVPKGKSRLGSIDLDEWLAASQTNAKVPAMQS